MGQTKHTPGPWRVEDVFFIFGPDQHQTADSRTWSRTPEEDEANARLIAAAPELLEALQEALVLFEGYDENDFIFLHDVGDFLKRVQMLIKKATGEKA